MDKTEFAPFYARLRQWLGPVGGPIVVSAGLGLAFLLLRLPVVGLAVFRDASWFLALLISTAMLCLYAATHALQELLADMDRQSRSPPGTHGRLAKDTLAGPKFVRDGILFGVANCAFGVLFGIPGTDAGVVTLLIGFFMVGFICGMAVRGIIGTSILVNEFAPKARNFVDFTSPDGCGGTSFVGGALVVFGFVTLLVGAMISVYILSAHWTHDSTGWIGAFKIFWIFFPYLMSFIVLVAPAAALNKELRKYKAAEEATLRGRADEMIKALERNQSSEWNPKGLRDEYEFLRTVRQDLHKMRTWPFSLETTSKYVGSLASTVAVHAAAGLGKLSGWLGKLLAMMG